MEMESALQDSEEAKRAQQVSVCQEPACQHALQTILCSKEYLRNCLFLHCLFTCEKKPEKYFFRYSKNGEQPLPLRIQIMCNSDVLICSLSESAYS